MPGISTLLKISIADFIVRTAYQMGKTPLLPIFAASLGASANFLGLIVSISTITGMLLKPIFGLLSDRWGRWIWLFTGTLIFTGMPFLYPWANSPEELLILRLIHGLATAIYGPVTVALVIEHGQKLGLVDKNCAERLGWFGVARIGGYLLGPILAAALLTEYDPQTVFTFIGILSSSAFLPICLLKDSNLPKNNKISLRQQTSRAFMVGIKTPEIWVTGCLECIVYLCFFATKTFLPLFALETGISILLVGLFFSIQELTHLITRPLGGRLSDRFGHLLIAALGMFLAASSFSLIPLIHKPSAILLLAIFLGISQAMIFPSTLALFAKSINTKYAGTGVGIIGTLKNSGKVIGPILGGFLVDWYNYTWMFWSISILMAFSSLGLLLKATTERNDYFLKKIHRNYLKSNLKIYKIN